MTKRNIVIDTGILTLFFSGDARIRPFFRLGGDRKAHVTSVSLAKFHYKTCQTLGEDVAELRYYQCRELLEVVETNSSLSLTAGKEKCRRRGELSLADCFAIAATKSLSGTLLTTDPALREIKEVDVRFFEVLLILFFEFLGSRYFLDNRNGEL